jgi:pimeloyl-ACP methyl ester carboxylesterase
MDFHDDDLTHFAAHGTPPLPAGRTGTVETGGARIWYADIGAGPPVILLHGGMGNASQWGHQVPALLATGHRAVLIDTRGHGRSTRDEQPFSYALLAADTRAVMDALAITRAAFIGWSDGACTALVLAAATPERVASILFFGCNVDPTGTKPFVMTDTIGRCVTRHRADYEALSPTPDSFDALGPALQPMQANEPDYGPADLAAIRLPVTVAHAERDEFIRPEHARYIAATIPGARLVELPKVSHFAPVQRPALFNAAMLDFTAGTLPA